MSKGREEYARPGKTAAELRLHPATEDQLLRGTNDGREDREPAQAFRNDRHVGFVTQVINGQ